jgi:hypothetical protein
VCIARITLGIKTLMLALCTGKRSCGVKAVTTVEHLKHNDAVLDVETLLNTLESIASITNCCKIIIGIWLEVAKFDTFGVGKDKLDSANICVALLLVICSSTFIIRGCQIHA